VAVHELTDEQIQKWSLEEKDTWWLKNVYRGSMPQLTIRSALTGMILGSLLSLTNLYVGAKTGWTLGVGITSVILAFAMFKVMAKLHLAQEFSILENNAMQSIATAAGYMTSPLISSLAAYMAVTNHVIPLWQTMTWMAALAILGVLFAFPFKRRFINDEQQPFPEGRAAGIVMDSLHHGAATAGLLKAKLLVIFGGIAAVVKLLQSEAIMGLIRFRGRHLPAIPEFYDDWFYKLVGWQPKILGTPLQSLTLRPELDLPMVGAGGLMGIRTGVSILLGAFINYAFLAPFMIERGDIVASASGTIGFRQITFWSLWCGVAMMTVASLLTFFAKPQMLVSAFRNLFGKRPAATDYPQELPPFSSQPPPLITAQSTGAPEEGITTQPGSAPVDQRITDVPPGPETARTEAPGTADERSAEPPRPEVWAADAMKHIELPLSVSLVGIPLLGVFVVLMAHAFFGVPWWLSTIAVFLVFFFCLIAINSTGLTSITPIGAMGKLTQLTFGILAPGNREVNLMTAGITGEVASHSANLLQDIKPGYMLGAKPRQQALGHVLGVLAGAVLSVPVFYLVFLKLSPEETFAPALSAPYEDRINADQYPMPAATIWKAVADVLTQGVHHIKYSAQIAALVGIIMGIVLELLRLRTKNRFPLSPVGIGLGFVIPFHTCLSMFLGAFIFWLFEKGAPDKESKVNQVVVQNQEPICAGLIAGGALMGIAVAVAELFVSHGP
jgi:uncharacterized oligopeptide transporter (OPT) family protein